MTGRGRNREGQRINGRHSGKPPAKLTRDRFISLLGGLAFNVNDAGTVANSASPDFTRKKMDKRDESEKNTEPRN